jgi:hypothetical protein
MLDAGGDTRAARNDRTGAGDGAPAARREATERAGAAPTGRPRVAFVSRKWPPAMGGMETYASRLAAAL